MTVDKVEAYQRLPVSTVCYYSQTKILHSFIMGSNHLNMHNPQKINQDALEKMKFPG